jgi:hypothetical protein
MRWLKYFLTAAVLVLPTFVLHAAEAKIIKVLPHYLDKRGHHSLSPSLYERDAYQERLRKNPQLQSGLRMDIDCKARDVDWSKMRVRVELRGVTDTEISSQTLEEPLRMSRWLGKWNSVTLAGEPYKKFGHLVAWRVTLWEGDTKLAEQTSFLWIEEPKS